VSDSCSTLPMSWCNKSCLCVLMRIWSRRVQRREGTPEFAELLLVYGRALIENAIAQNSVLGAKQAAEGQDEAQKDANGAGMSCSA
jgi:hypothetical protein